MKHTFIAGLLLAVSAMLLPACKHKHADQPAQSAAPGTHYICPMNCEKGKTYDQPGTCPVCHMDLEPVKGEAVSEQPEYFTAFSTSPAALEAGKPGMLSIAPKLKGKESEPVPLDLVHEKKMHLILVSDDLSWFDHVHPEYSSGGTYDIKVLGKNEPFTNGRGKNETKFETGGKYLAFTDYKPMGGLNQVNKTEFDVAGLAAKPVTYTAPKLKSAVDGYDVSLDLKGATLSSGTPSNVAIDITEKGKKLTPDQIENYLGAKAHVVMIETTSKEFVHVHPEAGETGLVMMTTFAKPGLYRGWLQFQTSGKVHTADFLLQVAQGAGSAEGQAHEHHH